MMNSTLGSIIGTSVTLNKPQLRVLEIGTGTTAVVLEVMHSSHGEAPIRGLHHHRRLGWVHQRNQGTLSQYHNLKFAVCDTSADPLEQGSEAASYDLIVASNVSWLGDTQAIVVDYMCVLT